MTPNARRSALLSKVCGFSYLPYILSIPLPSSSRCYACVCPYTFMVHCQDLDIYYTVVLKLSIALIIPNKSWSGLLKCVDEQETKLALYLP